MGVLSASDFLAGAGLRVAKVPGTQPARRSSNFRYASHWPLWVNVSSAMIASALSLSQLPDGAFREELLRFGAALGPGCLGRRLQDQVTGSQEIPERSESLLRRQRKGPRDVFEDHVGVARELDGQFHGRFLLRDTSTSSIGAEARPRRCRELERARANVTSASRQRGGGSSLPVPSPLGSGRSSSASGRFFGSEPLPLPSAFFFALAFSFPSFGSGP